MRRSILTILVLVLTLSLPAKTWASDDAAVEMPPNPWALGIGDPPRTAAEARGYAYITLSGERYCLPCDRHVWRGCVDRPLAEKQFFFIPVPAMLELNETLTLPRDIVPEAGVRANVVGAVPEITAEWGDDAEKWEWSGRESVRRLLAASLSHPSYHPPEAEMGLMRFRVHDLSHPETGANDHLVDDIEEPSVLISCRSHIDTTKYNPTCSFYFFVDRVNVRFWLPDSYLQVWQEVVSTVTDEIKNLRCRG